MKAIYKGKDREEQEMFRLISTLCADSGRLPEQLENKRKEWKSNRLLS